MEPRKKRKIMPLSGPDGFQKSPAKPKKISVPQFASAFTPSDHTRTYSFKAPHASLDPQLRKVAPLQIPHVQPTKQSVSPLTHATTGTGSSSIPTSRDFSHAYKARATMPLEGQKDILLNASHVRPSLKKLQPPDLTSIFQDHRTPTKPITPMKPVTSRLCLPIPDDHDKPGKKDFKTLSTTSIAKATDLSTESGNAELASILLYDQHPELVHGDADRSETRRGLNFSPRKKRYGQQNGPQFVRNGLATRASQLLSKSRTSLTLWKREMEAQTSSLLDEDPVSFSYLKPDLRLKVMEITHNPTPHKSATSGTTPNSQSPCVTIALCRVLQSPCSSSTTSDMGLSFNLSYHTLITVVFSNASSVSPSSIVCDATRFRPRVEVLVRRPWHGVKMPSTHGGTEEKIGGAVDETDNDQFVPASFPMSFTSSFSTKLEDPSGFRTAETVLMYSQFVLACP